jgi:hypothetical protein
VPGRSTFRSLTRRDRVGQLVRFDETRALKLLVACTDEIAVAHVVAQLDDDRPLVHRYLDDEVYIYMYVVYAHM